jgi:hypothetical protein
MRRVIAIVLVLAAANSAYAADRRKIRTLNIGVQAVMTLVSGAVQGKVRGLSDVARCLGSGAAAGYGSYEAKILAAKGAVQRGWLVANVAASLSENAASGKNPVAQFGYTIGPIRVRVAVPRFDVGGDSYIYVDVSTYEIATMARSIQSNDRIRFRGGLVAFERDTLYPKEDGVGPFDGTAWGVYPAVWVGADADVWNHEVIHAIQSLQGDAVEPSLGVLTYTPRPNPNGARRLIRFEHLKVGAVNLGDDYVTGRREYAERWTEIEAYRLAQDSKP